MVSWNKHMQFPEEWLFKAEDAQTSENAFKAKSNAAKKSS